MYAESNDKNRLAEFCIKKFDQNLTSLQLLTKLLLLKLVRN